MAINNAAIKIEIKNKDYVLKQPSLRSQYTG